MRDRDEEPEGVEVRDGVPAAPRAHGPIAAPEAVGEPTEGGRARRRVIAAAWLATAGAVAIFLGFGSVTLEAGARPGRSQRVVEVWRRFLADLPEGGNAALLRVVVVGLIAVVLLGSALGFWLAMTAADDSASRPLAGDAGGA